MNTDILSAIHMERDRQDKIWGGLKNDAKLSPLDWHEMIADYNGWARHKWAMNRLGEARERYIQVAALAAAAVEAIDAQMCVSTQTNIIRHPPGECGVTKCWCHIGPLEYGTGHRGATP